MNAYQSATDKQEVRDLASIATQIVAYAGATSIPYDDALPMAWDYLDRAAKFMESQAPTVPAGPPVLLSLEPAELSVAAPDTTVLFKGSGFTEESVIIWNGGEEPTTFVDAETLSTLVKPSTVSPDLPLPFSLPVLVRTGAEETSELQFTFTQNTTQTTKKRKQ